MNTLVRRPAIVLNVCDNDENACDGEIVGERKKKDGGPVLAAVHFERMIFCQAPVLPKPSLLRGPGSLFSPTILLLLL